MGRLFLWTISGQGVLAPPSLITTDVGFFYAIEVSADCSLAASVAQGQFIQTWRMRDGVLEAGTKLSAHQGQTGTLLFSSCPGWLASANSAHGMPPWDFTVRLWPADSSGVRADFLQLTHDDHLGTVAFLPSNTAVVAATRSGQVHHWPLTRDAIAAALARRSLSAATASPR
jgi:WD40 repeat protein